MTRHYRRGLDGAFVERVIVATVVLTPVGIIYGAWWLGKQWGWW
jgi:hypothetical protein